MSTIGGRVPRFPFPGKPEDFSFDVYATCRSTGPENFRGRRGAPAACDVGKEHARAPPSGVDGFWIDEATGMTIRGGIKVKTGTVEIEQTGDGPKNYAQMTTEPENREAHKRGRVLTVLVAGDTSDYDGFIALRPYVRHALRTNVRVRIVLAVNYPAYLKPRKRPWDSNLRLSLGCGFEYGFEDYRRKQIEATSTPIRGDVDPDPSAWFGSDASAHRQALCALAKLLAEEAIEDALEGGDRRLVELIVVHGDYNENVPFSPERYENEFGVYGETPGSLLARYGTAIPPFSEDRAARADAIVRAIARDLGRRPRDDLVFDLAGPCSFFTGELADALVRAELRPRFIGVMGGVESDEEPKTLPPSKGLNRLRASTPNQFYAPQAFGRLLVYAKDHVVPIVFATNNAAEKLLRIDKTYDNGIKKFADKGVNGFARTAKRIRQYYLDRDRNPAEIFDLLSTTAIIAFLHVPTDAIFRQSRVYYSAIYGAAIVTERDGVGGQMAKDTFRKRAKRARVPDNAEEFPPKYMSDELDILRDLEWTHDAAVWKIDPVKLKIELERTGRNGRRYVYTSANARDNMEVMMEGGWYDGLKPVRVASPRA